jgi:hypothetical protein
MLLPCTLQDRSVFPILLAVQKLSGVGADSIFMGVIRNRVDDDPSVVKVRLLLLPLLLAGFSFEVECVGL